ncbi:hypothetical protein [Kingella kingae]|uniref:hypothetical protein n=1 Tax=Kingella kingae TaxID=504 RepID=UPI0022A72CC6|nr:hypothetical protein [Kingella kingae]
MQRYLETAGALEEWLRSYRPEELFDDNGCFLDKWRDISPKGAKRMSVHPVTNGGVNPKA